MTDAVPQHILISNERQLSYWCAILNCNPGELREAIEKMGTCTDEVKLYLANKPNKKGLAFWVDLMK